MSAVAEVQPIAPIAVINQHEEFLLKLVERNVPIDAIEKYMDIRDRNARDIARQQFNEALANFRTRLTKVTRSKVVGQGPMKGTPYATLSDFVNASAPALAEFGLSAAWRCTKNEKDWIEIACILRHRGGHETETTFGGPPDVTGSKNAIQARASTASYLEKYTLKMATGLAEEDDDDDGNGGHGNRREGDDAHGSQATPPSNDGGKKEPEPKPPYPEDKFKRNLQSWTDLIVAGKPHDNILSTLRSQYTVSAEQEKQIRAIKATQEAA